MSANFHRGGGPRPGGPGAQSPTTSFNAGRNYYSNPGSGYSTPGGASVYSSRSNSTSQPGCLTAVRMTAMSKFNRYMRRLVHFRQMDFEFAAWQMLYLLIHPQTVYRKFVYRKRTKDQWARDDPAFLVLLAVALSLSSVLFAVALDLHFSGFILFYLWAVFFDCIFVGLVVATSLWYLSNKFLRRTEDQDVEWGYCFDVHLNAFFPGLILLHVVLPLLFNNLIDGPSFFSRLLGNSIWFVAAVYYVYITFLGYTALPILQKTHRFLYPITFLFIFYIATASAGWNVSQTAMNFYHFRAMNSHR
uniref:Protein unc-50 n=1 Tax=Panagrellus redivivus TaxID=6233 RepID=A0A7E4ZX18_PANRE